MTDRIYLGIYEGERVYLPKHSWDCGWYWGFGYVGNRDCHFHFETFFEESSYASEVFTDPNFTDQNWWYVRDLFIQAYALKKVAEVYSYGGHQASKAGLTDILRSEDKAKQANDDLELVLNALWQFMLDNNLGK
jgi:hypothetical protein